MIRIKIPQAGNDHPRLVPSVDIEKIQDAGHNLNVIISTGYAALVNSATYFIVNYFDQIRRLPICRGQLKYYVNKAKQGMFDFERTFKYEFPNLDVWLKNLELIDCIYEKLKPTCEGIYFALSNELGKTHDKDRDMLSNMIVSAILLRQAITLFDEILEKARRETMFNFRPYFEPLSAKCIEHPFGEAFMLVSNAYNIDALALTRIEPVRIGINAIVNIMGDERTYNEARKKVENM